MLIAARVLMAVLTVLGAHAGVGSLAHSALMFGPPIFLP